MNKKMYLAVMASLFMSACATVEVSGYIVPGETLDIKGSYYIVSNKEDTHSLYELVVNEMLSRGLNVSTGTREDVPNGIGFIIEYNSQWVLDITPYLLNFSLKIYDPKTRLLIASADSLRTSLRRKSPDFVVSETVNQLFK